MGRRIASAPIRFDITGLDPRTFDLCRQNIQAIIEQRSKGRIVSSSSSGDPMDNVDSRRDPELAALSKDQMDTYNKVVAIAIDFERAYGRTVYIRVFRRSSNKFLNFISGGSRSNKGQVAVDLKPAFYVNGVKVFVGVPNSFSELDEAIDRAFGHHLSGGRAELV